MAIKCRLTAVRGHSLPGLVELFSTIQYINQCKKGITNEFENCCLATQYKKFPNVVLDPVPLFLALSSVCRFRIDYAAIKYIPCCWFPINSMPIPHYSYFPSAIPKDLTSAQAKLCSVFCSNQIDGSSVFN